MDVPYIIGLPGFHAHESMHAVCHTQPSISGQGNEIDSTRMRREPDCSANALSPKASSACAKQKLESQHLRQN